jgi:hypothetical protein
MKDLGCFMNENMNEKVKETMAEIMEKYFHIWNACLRMTETKEEALASFRQCLIIDQEIEEELKNKKKA